MIEDNGKKDPIAIIGAGLAGLTAANFLYRENIFISLWPRHDPADVDERFEEPIF